MLTGLKFFDRLAFTMMIVKLLKALKFAHRMVSAFVSTWITKAILHCNGASFRRLRALGIPSVNVSLGGRFEIGDDFYVRTGIRWTEVGLPGTRLRVGPSGSLKIGSRVGISNCTIVAQQEVIIGDDVKIGGGAQIFDTNFHSLDPKERVSGCEVASCIRTAPVHIGDRVFIGTNAIVCKGVSIGDESIVAAGSVVVSDVPAGEIWGGNPAQRIK